MRCCMRASRPVISPGGPNVALVGVPPTVDSSELTSYEIGMKAGFADDRLQLDLGACSSSTGRTSRSSMTMA